MTLYSRVDREGRRILCGVLGCGGVMGRAIPQGLRASDGRWIRELYLEPGYVYRSDLGLWELSAHARKRQRRGKPPLLHRLRDVSPGLARPGVGRLPVDVRCPWCGSRQTLTFGSLQPQLEDVVICPATAGFHILTDEELRLPPR